MSTAAQMKANRRNAALSTGPSTAEGKAASSRNATTHGLAGTFTVLAHEDPAEFARLLADYQQEFDSQTEHERFLVQQMADARWRLARIRRFEGTLYQLMISNAFPQTPDEKIMARFRGDPAGLTRLERYATAAERSYYKAHRELAACTQSRQAAVAAADKAEAAELEAALDAILNAPPPSVKPVSQNEPNRSSMRSQTASADLQPQLAAAGNPGHGLYRVAGAANAQPIEPATDNLDPARILCHTQPAPK